MEKILLLYFQVEERQDIKHYKDLRNIFHIGKVDNGKAIDYFIIRNDSFPWHRVPDFVIGRPFYDKWMVRSNIEYSNDIWNKMPHSNIGVMNLEYYSLIEMISV